MSNREEALERLRPCVERARAFSGWAFPEIRVRALEPGPPWDYEALVRDHARTASSVLDLGTGGGEFVARLRAALPELCVATEEWQVNAPVAYRRLSPLGVHVVRCRSLRLPFVSGAFDLVIDRHEELEPAEVARVLQPGGSVVTQQVGRDNWRELREQFPRMTDFGDLRGEYARGFEAAGLTVVRNEAHDYKVAYGSLEDIVFMLLVAPWEIPDFGVERDIDGLLAVERVCTTEDGLVLTWGRFLLAGVKPG